MNNKPMNYEESMEYLKDRIKRCDELLLAGREYISVFDDMVIEDLPPELQEEYLEMLKDLNEVKLMRRKLTNLVIANEACEVLKKFFPGIDPDEVTDKYIKGKDLCDHDDKEEY